MGKISELKDRTVRITDMEFKITDSFYDTMTDEDVLILRKKSDIGQDIKNFPDTIYDLGYNSAKEIKYSGEIMDEKAKELDLKVGEKIEIAIVDPSGLIKLTSVIYLGPVLSDPGKCKLVFEDGIRLMEIKFLLISSLLADEYQDEINIYEGNKHSKPDFRCEDKYKEIIEDKFEKTPSGIPDDLTEIIDIFGDFFTRRFNARNGK